MSDRRSALETALKPFIESFAADGYHLKVLNFDGGTLDLAIEAEPHACAECLVPQNMMVELVRTQLSDEPDIGEIRIKYPEVHA